MPALALIAYSHDAVLCRLAPAEPTLVAAGRFTVAAVLLWPLVMLRERASLRRLGARELLLTLLAGTLLAADFTAWIAATQRTSLASSLLLTHLAPLWILLLTLLWLRRRPGPVECVVAALSIAGAGIVGGGGLAGQPGAHWHGDLLAVASSLPAAGFILLSAAALTRMRLPVYLALSWSWAGLLLAAAAWLHGAAWPTDRTVLGAIAVAWAQTSLSENFPSGWTYAQGLIFILVVGFFPAGLAGLGALIRRRKKSEPPSATTDIATVAADSGTTTTEGAKAL